MHKKVALFDMDGTLFDYSGQLDRDMQALASPGEPEIEDHHDDSIAWVKARRDLITGQPGWWRNLPVHQPGFDIHEMAVSIGFEISFLTKGPITKPLAWAEKLQCIQYYFGPKSNVNIVGRDKGSFYGRVLVDDYPGYLEAWLQHRPRGLAIMPAHNYNEHFSHPNVIRYDATAESREYVKKALQAAFSRESKEHWKDRL